MDHMSKFSKLALCVSAVALLSFASSTAQAIDADGTVGVTTTNPTGAAAITNNANFGSWVVIPNATSSAVLRISPASVLTVVTPGGPGQARFIGNAAQPVQALIFNLTNAIPQVAMSFRIGRPGVAAGAIAGATVPVTGGAGTGTFTASDFTCQIGTAAGAPAEVLTGYDPVTGIATSLTTGNNAGAGVANIACGVTLTTDQGVDPFTAGVYTGNVRVVVNY